MSNDKNLSDDLMGTSGEVAKKILRHSEALGGISRFTFQMDVTGISHEQYLNAIKLIGIEVAPRVEEGLYN